MNAKSCENCGRYESDHCFRPPNTECENKEYWLRNPRLWLDILPEQEGWYWWNKYEEDTPIILRVEQISIGVLAAWYMDDWVPIRELNGFWQGPIRPEG